MKTDQTQDAGTALDSAAAANAEPKTAQARAKVSGPEQQVPVDAIQMPGQDDQMMTPEVGDPVTYTVEGKLSRVDEAKGVAFVSVETVNGKPVSAEAAKTADQPEPEPGPDQSAELSQLRQMAGAMDRGGNAP